MKKKYIIEGIKIQKETMQKIKALKKELSKLSKKIDFLFEESKMLEELENI